MIDGEIYALNNDSNVVFAYCERGTCKTSFYICCYHMFGEDKVAVSNSYCIRGAASDSSSHLATEQERERFHRVLKENGYKWNQANKIIIKDGIEIIKI
jgi:hypothetical protein